MDDLDLSDVPFLEEDSGEQFEAREVLGIQTNLADLWNVDADLGQDVMTVYALCRLLDPPYHHKPIGHEIRLCQTLSMRRVSQLAPSCKVMSTICSGQAPPRDAHQN